MNKFFIAIVVLVFVMFSCTGNGNSNSVSDDIPVDSDSIVTDTVVSDTMEMLISETPMPKSADELFDNFFFNFAANRKLQHQRIKFPLPVLVGEKVDTIKKEQWKTEHFFMRQGYYTLIFDNRRQMDLVNDTSIDSVVVEMVNFAKKTIKQYVFRRVTGIWFMESIRYVPLYRNNNASFLKFYERFVTDSVFQIQSLSNPVTFVGPDPDDDFNTMEGLITPETWPAFAPELPSGRIYNIVYGNNHSESNCKIFLIRGISNGLEIEMSFIRKDGKWVLTKLIN
ncbi:DUF4348 domain-containing protein [Xylanibacter muris]|uniref:DUF4348 domain-containing protein n=1 Tax=Xylanibacter muris TaxID=2736290 RepID=A0ABX2AR18_9BACT|nr:DUF4348 domain-containing protein [Xylanibacter muris]NPD92396.1 DUF4348 domain-containing protein [Xylanibacter muris]